MEEKHFFSLGAVLPTTPYDLHKTRIFSGDKKDGENQSRQFYFWASSITIRGWKGTSAGWEASGNRNEFDENLFLQTFLKSSEGDFY